MSLFSAAERFAALDRSAVTLEASRCFHSQDKYSTCAACFAVCPVAAITPGKPPALDARKCSTCLACLPACPAGAFSADDAVPGMLTCAARLESGSVELICKQHPGPRHGLAEGQVGIQLRGCLAGLGAGAYLSLAALGMSRVAVRTESCSGCAWGRLQNQIEAQLALARQILAAYGLEFELQAVEASGAQAERPLWDADNPPLSRRDLFRLASRQGQVTLARTMAKDQALHGQRPGRDRQRMRTAIERIAAEMPAAGPALCEAGFADLAVSVACSACGACGRACQTGALKLEKNENHYKLKFSAWMCTGCEICLHVCAQQAIQIDRQPSVDQVFGQPETVLRSGELARCVRCNSWFAAQAGERNCPACEFRRTHPFGSKLPPGLDISKPASLRKIT